MKEESYGMIWGTIALLMGIGILLFVFFNAYALTQNPTAKLEEWVPDEIKGPTASFSWWSHNASVDFNDISMKGDGEITSWQWDFGDGSSSNKQNPQYDYRKYGDYTVTLEVVDMNGDTDSVKTRVSLSEDESHDGQTQQGNSFDLGITDTLKRIAVIILVTSIFAVMVMIGGRILLAGCRLLHPVPKTVKLKVKPRDMEVEFSNDQKKSDTPKDTHQQNSKASHKKSWFRRK